MGGDGYRASARADVIANLVEVWMHGNSWPLATRIATNVNGNSRANSVPHALLLPQSGETSNDATAGQQVSGEEIRAALLEYTARMRADETSQRAGSLKVAWDGAQLRHVRVTGCLDLRYLKFDRAIRFVDCFFEQPILLDGAEFGAVDLSGASVPLLSADNTTFHADVRLKDVCTLAMNFRGARVEGGLELTRSTLLLGLLRDWNEVAVNFIKDPAKRYVITSKRLLQTQPSANNPEIPEALQLWIGFDDDGRKKLLACMDAILQEGDKKDSPLATKKLDDEFGGRGTTPAENKAIVLEWFEEARAALSRLTFALGSSFLDWWNDTGSTWMPNFEREFPHTGTFVGDAINIGATLFTERVRVFGKFQLVRATIGGRWNSWDWPYYSNLLDQPAIDAEGISVNNDLNLSVGCRVLGGVSLDGATVSGHISFEGATVLTQKVTALFLQGAKVGGNLVFQGGQRRRCWTNGETLLIKAEIGGALEIGPDLTMDSLDLSWARAGVLQLFPGAFPRLVYLDGFVYERLGDSREGARFVLAFICRQPPSFLGRRLRPQPFLQLASVLDATGHQGEAVKVLVSLANRRLFRSDLGLAVSPVVWLWERRNRRKLQPTKEQIEREAEIFGVSRRIARRRLREEWGQYGAYDQPTHFWGFAQFWPRVVMWAIAGHGLRPFRVVPWLLAIWIMGAYLFGEAYDRGLMIPPPEQEAAVASASPSHAQNRRAESYEKFDKWVYSAEVTMPLVDLAQKRYWMPTSTSRAAMSTSTKPAQRIRSTDNELGQTIGNPARAASATSEIVANALDCGLARWWRWFATGIGWLLVTAFIGGYTGLIRPPGTR